MAITEIGFLSNNWNALSNETVPVRADNTDGLNLYLTFRTDYGTDTQDKFRVAIRFRGYPKGYPSLQNWSSWYEDEVPSSIANCHTSDYVSGYWWHIALSDVADLYQDLCTGLQDDLYTFENRRYDNLEFEVSIVAVHKQPMPDGSTETPPVSATMNIYYVPEYTLTSIAYESADTIVVSYTTTESWTRTDDRFCIQMIKDAPQGVNWLANPEILRADYWGEVPIPGRIELPTSYLREHIKGKRIRYSIRMVAAFRPQNSSFGSMVGFTTVQDDTICNTPTLSLGTSSNPANIVLNVGDSGDKNAPIEEISIKMTDGAYTIDDMLVIPSGTQWPQAIFTNAPFNTPLTFTAIGSRANAVSAPVTITVPAITSVGNITYIDQINSDNPISVRLQHNPSFDISVSSEKEVYKMAGRNKPVSYYGQGYEASVSVGGDVIDEDGNDWLALQQQPGDVVVRFPDGKRFAIAVDSVDLSWENRRIKTVSISGTEVDA